MKIYTKTGDDGTTSLFGGERVPKDSLRIEAYGTVDELNSIIGLCRSLNPPRDVDPILTQLQQDLFTLGADLATPSDVTTKGVKRLQSERIAAIEADIDRIDPMLQPLKHFILPGGSGSAAALHFARTVCRRAERNVVRLAASEDISPNVIIYLNRLSDYLFILARWMNQIEGKTETRWNSD